MLIPVFQQKQIIDQFSCTQVLLSVENVLRLFLALTNDLV